MRAVDQYLERYAQPEARAAEKIDRRYAGAVVVPAFRETSALLDGIGPVCASSGAVLILVVNRRAGDDSGAINSKLLDHVRKLGAAIAIGRGVELVSGDSDIVLIDRSSAGLEFDTDDGVGLARRIGLDFALAMWRREVLESDWLHTTDADATLPDNYFEPGAPPAAIAMTYPYAHVCTPSVSAEHRALVLYEISLRYFTLGLRHAGSPYAFTSIGSTIAVRADAYANVRGIPRRLAGEDFYLLNKLAKLGAIWRPSTSPIRLEGVRERRTPFGTAAAVANIAESDVFRTYDPRCFDRLKAWLCALDRFAADGDVSRLDPPAGLRVRQGLEKAFASSSDLVERRRRIHRFFDAKMTMRFVHCVRDEVHSNVPWQEAVSGAPFIEGDVGDELSWVEVLAERENQGQALFGVDTLTDQN